MKLIRGERIARQAILRPGASAIIFDAAREKVLLTRRTDNGRWCLPGGGMDPGETAEEACVREALEETGLHVEVTKLVGIYTDPHMVVEYSDGNRVQPLSFSFEAKVTGGELALSAETTDYGYFPVTELGALDLLEHHKLRIDDAVLGRAAAFYR